MLQYIILLAAAGLSVLLVAIWSFLAGVYVTQRGYGDLDAAIGEKYRKLYFAEQRQQQPSIEPSKSHCRRKKKSPAHYSPRSNKARKQGRSTRILLS